MKKELTINEIVTINETMKRIATSGKVSGKAAYMSYRNLSKTSKVTEDYEKARNDLIMKYGEPDPDVEGQTIVKRDSENYPKFLEDITEILNQTEEVDLYMISEDDMDKFADADLEVSDFAVIDVFLVDHPESETEKEAEKEEEASAEEAE